MSKASESVFPKASKTLIGNESVPDIYIRGSIGLTKREYFAGLAMQGLLAAPGGGNTLGNFGGYANHFAALSLDYADALLAELEKERK